MNEQELKTRTKQFALRVLKVVKALPRSDDGRVIAYQLAKSGTSVAANYRAVCRSRSRREFVARLGVVEEEADESALWLELIVDGGLLKPARVRSLLEEANQLVAIMTASRRSAQSVLTRGKSKIANPKSKISDGASP